MSSRTGDRSHCSPRTRLPLLTVLVSRATQASCCVHQRRRVVRGENIKIKRPEQFLKEHEIVSLDSKPDLTHRLDAHLLRSEKAPRIK